jgi:hypothetical protein
MSPLTPEELGPESCSMADKESQGKRIFVSSVRGNGIEVRSSGGLLVVPVPDPWVGTLPARSNHSQGFQPPNRDPFEESSR